MFCFTVHILLVGMCIIINIEIQTIIYELNWQRSISVRTYFRLSTSSVLVVIDQSVSQKLGSISSEEDIDTYTDIRFGRSVCI